MTGRDWEQALLPKPWFLDSDVHHEMEVARIMVGLATNRASEALEELFGGNND